MSQKKFRRPLWCTKTCMETKDLIWMLSSLLSQTLTQSSRQLESLISAPFFLRRRDSFLKYLRGTGCVSFRRSKVVKEHSLRSNSTFKQESCLPKQIQQTSSLVLSRTNSTLLAATDLSASSNSCRQLESCLSSLICLEPKLYGKIGRLTQVELLQFAPSSPRRIWLPPSIWSAGLNR